MSALYIPTITSSEMWIDPNLIIPEYKDSLHDIICIICLRIVQDPVSCSNCSSLFCKKCIQIWLSGNTICPMRCKYKETKIPKIALNLLEKTKFFCNKKGLGCKKIITFDSFCNHLVNECEYVDCRCYSCGYTSSRVEMKRHMEECEFIEVKCNMCQGLFQKNKLKEHQENVCQERKITCKECKEQHMYSKRKSHKLNCNFAEIICKFCKKQFKKSEKIEDHLIHDECLLDLKNNYKDKIDGKSKEIFNLAQYLKKKRNKLKEIKSERDRLITSNEELSQTVQMLKYRLDKKNLIIQKLKIKFENSLIDIN